MKPNKRIRRQANGLIEPYTVMIGQRPVVVEASSHEEAIELAEDQVSPTTEQEVSEEVTTENQPDGE